MLDCLRCIACRMTFVANVLAKIRSAGGIGQALRLAAVLVHLYPMCFDIEKTIALIAAEVMCLWARLWARTSSATSTTRTTPASMVVSWPLLACWLLPSDFLLYLKMFTILQVSTDSWTTARPALMQAKLPLTGGSRTGFRSDY